MALDQSHRFTSSAAPSASAGLRIGDAEREQAVQSLGAHLRAGRLTMVEYDERLQQAFAARTEADLTPLFADLPGGSPRSAPPRSERTRSGPTWSEPTAPSARRTRRTMPVPIRLVVVLALLATAGISALVISFPPLLLFPLFWLFMARRFGPRRHYGPRRNYDYAGPRRY